MIISLHPYISGTIHFTTSRDGGHLIIGHFAHTSPNRRQIKIVCFTPGLIFVLLFSEQHFKFPDKGIVYLVFADQGIDAVTHIQLP